LATQADAVRIRPLNQLEINDAGAAFLLLALPHEGEPE
jgi:hypothetical protein